MSSTSISVDSEDSSQSLDIPEVSVQSPFPPLKHESSLEVPEEPDDSDGGRGGGGGGGGGGTTPLHFVTAYGIARWMAKAYGFRAKKKLDYTSQDRLLLQESRQADFEERTRPMSMPIVSNVDGVRSSTSNDSYSPRSLSGRSGPLSSRRPFDLGMEGRASSARVKLSIVDEVLTGNEERDTDLVCKWIAVSFGQFDENYHAAYSREIIRQSRHAWGEIKKNKDPVWF